MVLAHRLVLHAESVSIRIQGLRLRVSNVVLDRFRTPPDWLRVSIVLLVHMQLDSEIVTVRFALRVALLPSPSQRHVQSVTLDCLLLHLACLNVVDALRVVGHQRMQ